MRLLDFVAIGPRFSNDILQTLLVLLKKVPPQPGRLLIIGTTSAATVMHDMGVAAAFNFILHLPHLCKDEIKSVLAALKIFQPCEVTACVAPEPRLVCICYAGMSCGNPVAAACVADQYLLQD